MLTIYDMKSGGGLEQRSGMSPATERTVWFDLNNPTVEEDAFVEKQLGIDIPTRAEAREIEASSRLYYENGAYFMTAFIIFNADAPMPSTSTITFILAGNRLVTVRYCDPKAFPLFISRVEKGDVTCTSAASTLIGLLEAIIHRAADLIERIQDEVEKLAQAVFAIKGGQQTRTRRLDVFLKTVGKEGDMTSRAQESALSLDRVLTFFQNAARERKDDPSIVQRIEITHRDAASLMEHTRFLAGRIAFLLDATLGMINIEQNAIIKIFSVAAVALMPPTLVASIYGMNFKHMPELDWPWGYPLAILIMIVSAIGPFFYFRRKGWF
jgi:magnesium transporter